MTTRKAFLHIGLPHSGAEFFDIALAQHGAALNDVGLRLPAKSPDEMFLAAVEIRRTHKAWGYRRHDVEGSWSAICRRAHKGKDTVVFSQDLLAAASADQIALLLDGLSGFAVHVVVTAAVPSGMPRTEDQDNDLSAVLDRWATAIGRPDRVHVIVADSENPRASLWTSLGRVIGFDAAALAAPEPEPGPQPLAIPRDRADELVARAERWGKAIADGGYTVYGDVGDLVSPSAAPTRVASTEECFLTTTQALAAALLESERLQRRCHLLEELNVELVRKRKKLKRRVADLITG